MRVNGKQYRTVWMEGSTVFMIDQTLLPVSISRFLKPSRGGKCCFAIKK